MSTYSLYAADPRPADRCPGFITDLILRCADGEEAALGSLFDHLYPLVMSLLGAGLSAINSDALVIATFRRLWEAAPAYDPKAGGPVEWARAQVVAVLAEFAAATTPEGPAVLTC